MHKLEVSIGTRYGNYIVLGPFEVRHGKRRVLCQCDCGNVRFVDVYTLVHLTSTSCVKCKGAHHAKHYRCGTRLYNIWSNMIQRTTNPKHPSYAIYGARGITVCDEWRDCASFLAWAKSSGYDDGLTLDRVDNDGNYCPENCRWVTRKVQQRNRRVNRLLTYKGETKCVAEWAETLGLSPWTLLNRVKRGWSVEKALSTPTIHTGLWRMRHVL